MFETADSVFTSGEFYQAMCLFLRNLPIATKYAYCSTETWMSHNTKHIEFKYLSGNQSLDPFTICSFFFFLWPQKVRLFFKG